MTDTTAFLNLCVSTAQAFNQALEDLKSISDRIGSDSALSTNTALAAQNTSRKDLTAADFDNFKVFVDNMALLFNSVNGGTVPVSINTGGKAILALYKMI